MDALKRIGVASMTASASELSAEEQVRYERHLMMPEIDRAGQLRLRSSRVVVVGAGGLGAPILYYLTAAGVGEITIVDHDRVSLSNLQRQVLYTADDIGSPKATRAAERLRALNSHCHIRALDVPFGNDNALTIARGAQLIIDGTDNLATRYLLDDTAQALGIPYLYGAVSGLGGQCSLLRYQGGMGYRDLFADYDTAADRQPVGLISTIPGIIGTIMATEALLVLLGMPPSLADRMLCWDARTAQATYIQLM